MTFSHLKSSRFQNDLEFPNYSANKVENGVNLNYKIDGTTQIPESSSGKTHAEGRRGRSLKAKVLSRVFSEDYERVKKKIFDPRGPILHRWNKMFLVACLVSLFVDPLFFYLPGSRKEVCIEVEATHELAITTIRTVADLFYIAHIFVRFQTAFVAPSSRVFGRGELVIDPSKIASRYLANGFWLDLVAALPVPQVMIWMVIPRLKDSIMANTKNVLRFSIIFQYFPRLYLIFPLSRQIVNATGVVTETAWAGAAYNLILYMLASHVMGAAWYFLSVERQETCWKKVCSLEASSCSYHFFTCGVQSEERRSWFKSSNVTELCDPRNGFFKFGIYEDAMSFNITAASFFNKYFYCLWWGLRNLSSAGQNLLTSTFVSEISFAIVIAIIGLVLFGLLIGNMQTYLQSTTMRLEEWRIRRMDTEQWMSHRQLPPDLRQCVRRYDQFKWLATRGVDEENLLKGLPADLRRDIKRHLCLDLVRRVPLFDEMDEKMLDAICERLKPALCTQGTCLMREGDPVSEMLFIIRGHLDSCTTGGGRTGFFNCIRVGPGEFCGEELLTWALDPRPGAVPPSSTRTVNALSEVEAFALSVEDVQFVAAQFRRLHSKQLRHKFRFYSHQWRTWAACFIQAVWRRFKRRKLSLELKALESSGMQSAEPAAESPAVQPIGLYAARLAASTRRGGLMAGALDDHVVTNLQKPAEPDFTAAEED